MKGTIETPQVAKVAMSLLTHLFSIVIITLEKESSNKVVFGKQMEIKKNLLKIQSFILTHPYGIFHIEMLDSIKRDLEDPLLSITFKNYMNEVPGKIPMEYHIILDETYTTFEAYQSSLGGMLLKM